MSFNTLDFFAYYDLFIRYNIALGACFPDDLKRFDLVASVYDLYLVTIALAKLSTNELSNFKTWLLCIF